MHYLNVTDLLRHFFHTLPFILISFSQCYVRHKYNRQIDDPEYCEISWSCSYGKEIP